MVRYGVVVRIEITVNFELTQYWNGDACSAQSRVSLSIHEEGECLRLDVDAPFYNDPAPQSPAGSTPHLWEYEVVECFIVGEGRPIPYIEIELGPHGHHLVLQLCGIRTIVQTYPSISYTATIHGERWSGTAFIPKVWLPNGPWTHNAFAIHGQGLARKYLTLYPTLGAQPDFHRLHTFRPLEMM